jgi:hypothetical protein
MTFDASIKFHLLNYGSAAASMLQEDGKFSMQQPAAPQQHAKSGGAGGSIVNILEVCESDFATNLAKEESEEADSAESYEKTTQENKVTKMTKSQELGSQSWDPPVSPIVVFPTG